MKVSALRALSQVDQQTVVWPELARKRAAAKASLGRQDKPVGERLLGKKAERVEKTDNRLLSSNRRVDLKA